MISKEFFANTMNRLYEQENKILAVDKALVDLDNDFGGFGIPSASSISLDILKECLNDENNWLDYFIYELDWLNNIHDECIIEDNSKYVVIKTWEDVYDFITKNYDNLLKDMINIEEINGDIFSNDDKNVYYAHCISNDYALGAGIAVAFNNKYDMRNKLHEQYPNNNTNYVGKALKIDNVYNLVTKDKYWLKPTYDSLTMALKDLRDKCLIDGVENLAIPKLGCGLDKLDWNIVKNIIKNIFKDLKINITCYYI